MSGKLSIYYLDGGTSPKTYVVAAATEINIADGILSYKEGGKLRGFSVSNFISFAID